MKILKKYFGKYFTPSYKKQIQSQRDRLFFRPQKSVHFKARKKISRIKIPNFFSYIPFHQRLIPYYFLGIIGIIVIGVTIFILGPFARIDVIEIVRKEDITNIDISYKSMEDFRGKSLFLTNTKEIAEKLKSYQKNIKEVSIKKEFPNTLKITIESFKGIFTISLNGKTYTITENGVLIPKKENREILELKLVERYQNIGGVLDYKQFFLPSYISTISQLKTKIESNLLSMKIQEIYYFPDEREVHYDLQNGTKLIFDLEGIVDDQLKKLLIFHKEQASLDTVIYPYIDLRVKGKIFFCPAENQYQCHLNLENIYGYTFEG